LHTATRIIAIRHGETAWNVDARIQGSTDIALNDIGRWQAQRLAGALAHEIFEAVYSSDLQRAHETACSLAAACGKPVIADSGLRERRFGVFEGLTFAEIEARWPEQSQRWRQRDPDFGPNGGEVLSHFYQRCVQAMSRLAARHAGATIALVSHGGVLDCLYRAATRLDLCAPRTWKVANASINRVLCTAQGFTLVGWGDTLHLDAEVRDEVNDPASGAR
jgi:2,3-bisphosphoglycerate-dependent phosphoglycerate mutase